MSKEIALVMETHDNVATALEEIAPGTEVALMVGDAPVCIRVSERIPFAHKFALADIPAGALVVKYGQAIGTATADIAAGRHVHVHNLESRRGRGDR